MVQFTCLPPACSISACSMYSQTSDMHPTIHPSPIHLSTCFLPPSPPSAPPLPSSTHPPTNCYDRWVLRQALMAGLWSHRLWVLARAARSCRPAWHRKDSCLLGAFTMQHSMSWSSWLTCLLSGETTSNQTPFVTCSSVGRGWHQPQKGGGGV